MVNDERELLRGSTPTLVLAVLKDEAQHGYAIAREVNRRTEGALKFKQGTLYPVLHALERDGLIAGQWEHLDGERPRKVYTITSAGRVELTRRAQVWQRFSGAVSSVIGTSEGGAGHEQPA